MERTVIIAGKEVRLKASALVPRLYRYKFGRDMVVDIARLQKACAKAVNLPADATEEERAEAQLTVTDLTLFEDVAYIMAKHGGTDVPDTPEEWLDSMDGLVPIYSILPVILELWTAGQATTSVAKKK